jgi:hypothetical protein
MSWILGNTDRLMDARFAAAAGAERLVLSVDADAGAWNEISGWVAGPDLWLMATPALVEAGLGLTERFMECKGLYCRDSVVWEGMESLGDAFAIDMPGWALELSPEVLGHLRNRGGWGSRMPDWLVVDPWALDAADGAFVGGASGPNLRWFGLVSIKPGADPGNADQWGQRLKDLAQVLGTPCAGLYFEARPGQDSEYVTIEDWVDTMEGRFV